MCMQEYLFILLFYSFRTFLYFLLFFYFTLGFEFYDGDFI